MDSNILFYSLRKVFDSCASGRILVKAEVSPAACPLSDRLGCHEVFPPPHTGLTESLDPQLALPLTCSVSRSFPFQELNLTFT